MKKNNRIKLFLCAIVLAVFTAHGQERIHVAANGSDSEADGSQNAPFATLEHAINAAKPLISEGKNIEICLKDGVYFVGKTISLDGKTLSKNKDQNCKLNLTISSQGNALISGGIRVDAGKLEEVFDKNLLSRLPEKREGKLFKLNLKSLGIVDFGKITQAGFGSGRGISQVEAFYNMMPLTLARYPNFGIMKIGKVIDSGYVKAVAEMQGALKPKPDNNIRGATFEYLDSRHNRWAMADDAWIYGNLSVGWADDRIKIKKIDVEKKTVELASPHIYGVRTCLYDVKAKDAWKVAADLDMRGYCALNLFEEIDAIGEYYIDRKSGIFYVMLAEKPDGGFFDFSVCADSLLEIKNASAITVKNIEFANSRGGGIVAKNVTDFNISNCKFHNFGLNGVDIQNPYGDKYNSNIKIYNCLIFDNAYSGILINAGYRKDLIDSSSSIDNCEFYKNGRVIVNYSPSLGISGVGIKVRHCYFHDQKYLMLSYSGNDLLIEANYFERCAKDASDMGIIYGGRDQSWQGNVIRYNIFAENTPTNINDNVCGVYVDDGSCNFLIEKNIFCRTGNMGRYGFAAIFLHGGHDNIVNKNVFIDCPASAAHGAWNEERWQGALKRERARLKEAVDIESEIYLKKYPHLANMLKPNQKRINKMTNNLLYNTQMPFKGEWSLSGNKEIQPLLYVPNKIYWNSKEVEKYFGDNQLVKEILSKKAGLQK